MQITTETRVGTLVLVAIALFVYMGFKIGAFRLNTGNYNYYTLVFENISGLSRKADVKISGVSVGRIEQITLIPNGTPKAQVKVSVLKKHALYSNATGYVRQDGLLGPKYVEIDPGDSSFVTLPSGYVFSQPGQKPVDIDKLLHRFDKIAVNIQEFTHSLNTSIGGAEGTEQLQNIVENLNRTVSSFASIGNVIEKTLDRNEDKLDALVGIGTTIQNLSQKLENNVLPSFQESIEKISVVFDRDFNRIATGMELTTQSLDKAAQEAQEGLKNIRSVTEKINNGTGLLGKIINEDTLYQDLKIATTGFRKYADRVDRLQIIFDTHFESMLKPGENYLYEDGKGYFNARIYPNEYYFYVLQIATSEKGFIDRKEVERSFIDANTQDPINLESIDQTIEQRVRDRYREQKLTFRRNAFKFGVQVGTIFKNVAVRMGLFEGMAGFGVDVDIPIVKDSFRWATTIEMFDFSGWNRKLDRRPHVKWLNKIYVMRNVYFTFGADDFASKNNRNIFVGGGIRFGDDDVKYLLGNLSGVGSFAK